MGPSTGGFWSCCNDIFGDFLKIKLKERMEAMISLQNSEKKLSKEMRQLRESRELRKKEAGTELNKDFRFELNPKLQGWFKRVQEVGEKVDKFDDQYLNILNGPDRVRGDEGSGASKEANGTSQAGDHLGGCSCNMLEDWGGRLCLLVKLSGKVADLIGEVREVVEEGNRINKMVVEKGKAKKTCDAANMVGSGAQVALAKIRKHLEDDKVGIIAIYGTAGVGKSELLRQIVLEYSGEPEFDPVVISVEVTATADLEKLPGNPGGKIVVDVERLRSNIAKDLPGSSTGWDANSLKEALSQRRFLLLLENVWEKLDLDEIGIPRPSRENKSKIVFTTRSKAVLDKMGAEGVELGRLTDKEGRALFRRELNRDDQFYRCKSDAKKIVRECHGLPLALKVMAQVMRSKNFDKDWSDTVVDLQDPRTMFGEGALEEKDVLSPLAYSYHHLRADWRPCLVYCSLFDSSVGIDREELIDYWIGEGFFGGTVHGGQGRDVIKAARREGKKVINHLVSSCMLECSSHGGETVTMHGLIRDMAIKMAANELLVYPDSMNTEEQKGVNWEKVKRISLMGSTVSKLPTKNCSTLETLLLKNCTGLTEIPAEFFNNMSALLVLDLSHTGIQVLPEGIGNLKQLRHLNLSHTRIISLPAEVSELNMLRQLNLSYTRRLQSIPPEAISGSDELRTLNLFQSKYRTWVWNADDPARGLCLFDLDGLQQLEELSLNINNLRDFEDLLLSEVARYTVCLRLEGVSDLKGKTDQFQVLERLRELHITNILSLDKLVFKSKWLGSLEKLVLSSLSVADISIGEQEKSLMPSLRSLEISKCKNLANLSWVRLLRDISTLSVSDCEMLKAVIGIVDHGGLGGKKQLRFKSNLKMIALKGLPNLESFSKYSVELPAALSLAVDDCPKLTGAFVYYDGQGTETRLQYQDCQKAGA